MGSETANVNDLFNAAASDDIISQQTLDMLQVTDLGTTIADALGTPADQFEQSEVVLVGILVDDSGSIRFAGNAQAVRDGHNLIKESLIASKQQDNILWHCRLLNGEVITPFVEIGNSPNLDTKNYDPNLGTPLYDQTVVFLGTVLAKAQEFSDQGVPCRTISLIITDGADVSSRTHRENDCKKIIEDMLRQENHIIAAMGIEDEAGVDFGIIFKSMGIRSEWVMTPDSSESEIRKACHVFSQSAVRASQSAGSFSQQAIGGLGS